MVYVNLELLEPGILWLDLYNVVRPQLVNVLVAMGQDFVVISRISFLLLIALIAVTVFAIFRKKKG